MPRRRSGKKIDFVHWTVGRAQAGGLTAGTAAVLVFAALHEPETLLRMRGTYLVYADQNQAPGVSADMACGLILVPEGTGTTVLWSPITDGDAPWIWWNSTGIGYEEMVTDVVDVGGLTSYREVIDNKAMRISRNQELQCVFENVTVGGALAMNAHVNVRVLAGQ